MKWNETKNTTSEYVECSLSRDEGECVEVKTYIQKIEDRKPIIKVPILRNQSKKHKDEPKSKKKEYNKVCKVINDIEKNQ